MPFYVAKRKRSNSSGSYRKKSNRRVIRRGGPTARRHFKRSNIRGFKHAAQSARWPGLTLPAKVMKKFEYEDTQFYDTTNLNGSVVWTYTTNDIYDPNYTATLTDHSVQNYGVFINSGMYRQWRVFGCKIKVTCINLGGSQAMVVPMLTTLQGTPVSGHDYENTNALTALPQAAEPIFVGPLTGGNNIVRRTYYTAPWVPLGVSRMQYSSDTNTAGAYSTRPVSRSFMSFNVIGVGDTTQATIEIRVSMVYYCQLFDLAVGHDTLTPAPAAS